MLAAMERVDGFDKAGHLLVTESHRVAASMHRSEVERMRTATLARVAGADGVVRARLLPMQGRPVDVGMDELATYVKEHADG